MALILTCGSGCGKSLFTAESLDQTVNPMGQPAVTYDEPLVPGTQPSTVPRSTPDPTASLDGNQPSPSPTPALVTGGYLTSTSPLQVVTIDPNASLTGAPGFNIASSADLGRCLANVNHQLAVVPCGEDPNQLWKIDNHMWKVIGTGECLNFSGNTASFIACPSSPQTFTYAGGQIVSAASPSNGCLQMAVDEAPPYAASVQVTLVCGNTVSNLQQFSIFRRSGSSIIGTSLWESTANGCLDSSYLTMAGCNGSADQRWVLQGDQVINGANCLAPYDSNNGGHVVFVSCTSPATHGWALVDTVLTFRGAYLVSAQIVTQGQVITFGAQISRDGMPTQLPTLSWSAGH